MSIDADPKNQDNDGDDEFAKHFNDFAAKTAPEQKAEVDDDEPEGNVPEVVDPAPAKAATEEAKPPASDTSGETEGGEKPPEAQTDILATLTPEARALVEQLQKERDEARHKASSDASRVSALSKKLQSLNNPPPLAEDKPSEAQKILDAKIAKLRTDYGDIAEPIIEMMEQQRVELGKVKAHVETFSEDRREALIAEQTKELEARHPDWQQVATSPDFKSWIEVQPENIQRLAASWDARESSVALTLFKTERAETSGQGGAETVGTDENAAAAKATADAKRKSQLEGGRDVRSRPAPAASGPPEDFDAAFQYFTEKRLREAANSRR